MATNKNFSQENFVRSNQRDQQINLSYRTLIDFHIRNLRVEAESKKISSNSINNHMTAINKWLEFATWLNRVSCSHIPRPKVSPSALIGAEFAEDFDRQLLEHLVMLEKEKLASTTISNRKSLLMKWYQSYILLMKTASLPTKFSEAVDFLLDKRDVRLSQVARNCHMTVSTLLRWKNGKNMPGSESRQNVIALESYFNLPQGTLLMKTMLPVCSSGAGLTEDKSTPHRRYISVIRKKPYKLRFDLFSDKQQQEWQDLFRFYTNHAWVAAQGLERSKRGWRTRRSNQKNSTGEIKLRYLQNFYGHLCLPLIPESPNLRGIIFDPSNKEHQGVPGLDPHLTGLGLFRDKLSLSLLSDTSLIHSHIEFLRGRAFGHVYNTYVRGFLNFCRQLVLPKKGFLWQHSRFGQELVPSISSERDWQERCAEAHRRIKNIIRNLESSEDETERFRQSRDTSLRVVRPLIREREHPVSVLTDITEGIRKAFNIARTRTSKAILFRDMLMVGLLASNPVRAINMVEMKYQDGSKGDEEDNVNLYKLADGSYRLKYEVGELKNGAQRGRYDLPVSTELTQDIDEYLSLWRPLLADANECHYVFRPALNRSIARRNGTSSNKPEGLAKPISVNSFSRIINLAARRFVRDCAGFGPHAARHFVATEWLKFNPSAYSVAAAILHDSEKMVKEFYSWVMPNDIIPFWMQHLGKVIRQSRISHRKC